MSVVNLDAHRTRLGGSTLPAACGVDRFCSPIRLWLEMTRGLAREETEAMRLGTRLQPVIFAELNERGYRCVETPEIEATDAAHPWLVGHPDGVCVGVERGVVVEAKATGRATDTPPVAHVAQVQTYLHLLHADAGLIAQLGGLQLTVWEVERDQRAIDTLLHLGAAFMDDVRAGRQPAPLGHPDDRAALGMVYPDATPRQVRETREIRDARRELAMLLEREKVWKARVEHLRAVITDYMGDADTLISLHDDVAATWKGITSTRLDGKALKRDRPEVWGEYATESTTRRLDLK